MRNMRRAIAALICTALAAGSAAAVQGWFDLPELLPPSQYGNMLISRAAGTYDMPSVSFSHWRHRALYTCRVCHFELEFALESNTTVITEEDNKNGLYCGACHDGKTAFGHTEEHCSKCHNGDIAYGSKKFRKFARRLPRDGYGNKIDWTGAMRKGEILPKQSVVDDNFSPIPFKKFLILEAEWSMIPPSIFPHREHTEWLDCANCHPDTFNIKKKTTKHFLMKYILEGKFCGVCHLNVAFPLDDCYRCHPKRKKK